MDDIVELFTQRATSYERFIGLAGYEAGLAALVDHRGYLAPDARVLDAGCGTGAFTRAVHTVATRHAVSGVRYHAFDLTPGMLDHLVGWARTRSVAVETRRCDVLRQDELPADWRDFDLIVSSGMLEYLDPVELPRALAELASRLSPDGRLVVCITRRNLPMQALIGAWWRSNLYSRAEIERSFREAGLEPSFARFPGRFRYLDLWGHVVEAGRPDA